SRPPGAGASTLPGQGYPTSSVATAGDSHSRRQINRLDQRRLRHLDCCTNHSQAARRYDTAHLGVSDSSTYPAKLLMRYAAAVLAVAIALACTALALPLSERSQLFLFLAAVVLSAWYGGSGPG